MKLSEVLEQVKPVVGHTSIVEAMIRGDVASILLTPATDETSLDHVESELLKATEAQRVCTSDPAWWACEARRVYWAMVMHLMDAARLVGPDHLPDVPLPSAEGRMVMDIYGDQEDFGQQVLARAHAQAAS